MIPAGNDELKQDFSFATLPSNTFKIHPTEEVIAGNVDQLEAVKQAVYLILSVERYQHLIYSWDYGAELADLMGQPVSFCLSEIKRKISEALLQDDRITAVDHFAFEVQKGRVHTTFRVTTIFGTIETEKAVMI